MTVKYWTTTPLTIFNSKIIILHPAWNKNTGFLYIKTAAFYAIYSLSITHLDRMCIPFHNSTSLYYSKAGFTMVADQSIWNFVCLVVKAL